MTDYAQMLLEGMDVLIKERLKSINFDATIKCTVTNANRASEGQYEVSNGSATFMAYSDNTEYKVDDSVLVIIPNNDYNNQKYILGKETSDSSTPYVYNPPFSTFIDITSNLCSKTWDDGGEGLYANGYKTGVESAYDTDNNEHVFSYIWSGDFTTGNEDTMAELKVLQEFYNDNLQSLADQYDNNEITKLQYDEAVEEVKLWYSRRKATYDNNISLLTGYDRLGIAADFQTFLNAYNCIDGDYGLMLKIFLYEHEPVIKVFSAKSHFFGDIYNFDSFYRQEVVFPIEDIQDKFITRLELYFYQDQTFKDKNGQYIYSKDFNEAHAAAFQEGNYETLTDFFASDVYAEYDPDDISNAITNYLPNLFVKDAYICLGYDAANFEGNDKAFLSSSSTPTYNSSQSELDLTKILHLRWVHKNEEGSSISIISRSAFSQMTGYLVRWYREEQGVRSPDAWAGENWRIIKTFQPGTEETATDNAMYQEVIPRIANARERYKVIIAQNTVNGFVKLAESNEVSFFNEEEVENTTQTDLLNGLTIHCGFVRNGNLESDDNQGMFFIYKKGNELVDKDHANRFLYTVPCFTSVKRYADETRPYLTRATKVVWTVPASYSMIIPQYQDKALQRNMSANTLLTEIQNNCFFNAEMYNGHRHYLAGKVIDNVIKHIVCYNDLLDMYEIAFVNYPGELFESDEITYVPTFQYKIHANYSPAYINNTIQLDVEKDGNKYHAEREFYFGQAGTSGSDYTLIIDFEEHQEALSLYTGADGIARDYGSEVSEYQLIPFLRLANHDGTPFIDLANSTLVQEKGYTFKWDWLTCEVNGDLKESVGENTNMDKLYPVFFSDSANRHQVYGTTTSGSTARPFGTAFGYSNASTAIAPVAGEDAKYAFYENFRTTQITSQNARYNISVNDYYFYDKINNTFVQEFETPKTNVQYYRHKRPLERDAWNNTMYNFTFKRVKIQDATEYSTYANKRLFIKLNGNYVLDFYGIYRAEVTYYKAVYQGQYQSNSNTTILQINTPNQYKTRITLNPSYLYNGSTPQIFDVMNSLSILRATVEGVKDYPLVAYWPVALRRVEYSNHYTKYLPYGITGATYVRYSSSGEMPDFYNNSYTLRYYNSQSTNWQGIEIDDINTEDNTEHLLSNLSESEQWEATYKEGRWELICPTAIENDVDDKFEEFMRFIPANINDQNVLAPFSTYIENAPLYGVQYQDIKGKVRWTQPILVYQDNYPSATLNQWNGTDLVMDETTGTILATSIGAGKKEEDNTFSGVIMGDWSKGDNSTEIAEQTGVYGFSHGQMSYALKEDGTAFFGKDGSGRIHLMGDKAQIYSSNWLDTYPEGMMFDLDDGVLQIQHNIRLIEAQFQSSTEFSRIYNSATNDTLNKRQLFEYRSYIPQINRTINLNDTMEKNNQRLSNYYVPVAFIQYKPKFNNMQATPYYLFTRQVTVTSPMDITDIQNGVRPQDNVVNIAGDNSYFIQRYRYYEQASKIYQVTTIERYDYIARGTALSISTIYYRISRYEQVGKLIETHEFNYSNTLNPAFLFRKNSLYYGKMNVLTGQFQDGIYPTMSELVYQNANQWNPNIRYYRQDPSADNQAHYLTMGDRATQYALSIGNSENTISDRNFVVQWDGTLDTKGNINVWTGANINIYDGGNMNVYDNGNMNVYDGGNVNIYDGGQLRIYDNQDRLAVAGGSENALNSEIYDGITGSLVIYNRGNLILDGGNIYAYDGIIYGGEIRGGLFTRQMSSSATTHELKYQASYNSTINYHVDSSSKAKYFEGVYGQIYEDAEDIKAFERQHALVDIDAGFLGDWFVGQDAIVSKDTGTYLFSNGYLSQREWSSPTMSALRASGISGLKPPFEWDINPDRPANIATERIRLFFFKSDGRTAWGDLGVFSGERISTSQSIVPSTLIGLRTRTSSNGLGIQTEGSDSDIGIKSFYGGVYISGGYKDLTEHGRSNFYVGPGNVYITSQSAGTITGTEGSNEEISIKMLNGVLTIKTAKPEDQKGIYARFA